MTAVPALKDEVDQSPPIEPVDDGPPPGALTWRSPRERFQLLLAWRTACIRMLDREARQVRLAWFLEGLFHRNGYCNASNGFLAQRSRIAENKVQEAVAALQVAGAIVRKRVGRERQIWPCNRILEAARLTPPSRGSLIHPREGTPVTGVQNTKSTNRRRSGSVTTVMSAARLEAERRAARERGESPLNIFGEPGE
jgi:hypothetical protein